MLVSAEGPDENQKLNYPEDSEISTRNRPKSACQEHFSVLSNPLSQEKKCHCSTIDSIKSKIFSEIYTGILVVFFRKGGLPSLY